MSSALAILALLCFSPEAQAINARPLGVEYAPPGFVDFIGDLDDSRRSVRRFAAANLERQVKRAVRIARRPGEPGIEARLFLEDADRMLAPRCLEHLDQEDLRVRCARILATLETPEALPALEQALDQETRKGARRRLERAISSLQEASS